MKKYIVYFEVYASTSVEVTADTEDEARDTAWHMIGSPSLCHQCSTRVEIGDIGEIKDVQEVTD